MAKANWLVNVRQIWCGLTSGHDFSAHHVTEGDEQHSILICQDCAFTVRSRKTNSMTRAFQSASEALTTAILKDGLPKLTFLDPAFPQTFPKNAGETTSKFTVPPDEIKGLGKRLFQFDSVENRKVGKLAGRQPVPFKASVAKRNRGPNGRFLPKFTKERLQESVNRVQAQLKRKRNKNGQFAKGKKK